MDGPPDGPPIVVLPERMDRRLRLGPFPSAHDALKFLAYAAVGSVVAISVSTPVGLLLIAVGFGVTLARVDGEPLDRCALAVGRFLLRLGQYPRTVTPRAVSQLEQRGFARGPSGELLAVIRASGTPMAYLPPAEIARRFERFRELLRSTDGELVMFATLATMRPRTVLPGPIHAGETDRAAHDGYGELVRRLCDRRRTRRIDLFLVSKSTGTPGAAELDGRVDAILVRLAGLEIRAHRLVGRSLVDSLGRAGILTARGAP